MKKIFPIFALLLTTLNLLSQNSIMTIDGKEISTDEFERVYSKNNNITPNTEQKSVDEYIDLFVNYKLKVIEAENQGYDTMKTFVDEFNGYTKQLAKPYLQDKTLKEELIKEAYERSKYEVRASHLLLKLDDDALPKDTLKVYEKIMEIRSRVIGGEPFGEVAKATSDDESVKQNGGDLGFFSVFRMVYPFECGAFNTEIGKISMPVRTRFGYHLINVTDKRDARGSVNVAHVMTRVPKEASAPEKQAAIERIEEAYHKLMNGADWSEIVQEYSEHNRTKENDGNIGWLKIGQAPENFMEECFKLDVGQFSKPIETDGGFHIAKIIEKKPIGSFEESKDKIAKRVDSDRGRIEALQHLMDGELKAKYGFDFHPENSEAIVSYLDSSIYEMTWNPGATSGLQKTIVKVGDITYTQSDYAVYISKLSRPKVNGKSFNKIVSTYLQDYASELLKEYAMSQLPNENDDYKHLLQEYHDGILLFNLTNDMVWKKAQEDTMGLQGFYKTAKKYEWGERIVVDIYEYTNNAITEKLPKIAKKKAKKALDISFVTNSLCPEDTIPCVKIESKTYEKGQDSLAEKLPWEKGAYTTISEDGNIFFYYVKKTHPAESKKLNEARGLYIADYQTYLEEQWVNSLREKYTVEINDDTLKALKDKLKE